MKFRNFMANAFGTLAIFGYVAALFAVAAGTICHMATGKCIVLVLLCVFIAGGSCMLENRFRSNSEEMRRR